VPTPGQPRASRSGDQAAAAELIPPVCGELRRLAASYMKDEIAGILSLSPETVRRDWRFARTWLSREIHQAE
jgi:hypothetical protein